MICVLVNVNLIFCKFVMYIGIFGMMRLLYVVVDFMFIVIGM